MSDHRADTIRALNDVARQTFTGCLVVTTEAFNKFPLTTKAHVLKCVREVQDFEVRDTEHRYGVIDYQGTEFFFHMAYYDLTLQVHSPDPANPRVTRRVLTVGVSSEDL
jgi:hypothetical protein